MGPCTSSARVDEVRLGHDVQAVALRLGQPDVDDAAHGAAVLRAEVARVEVDSADHLGGDDRGEAAEVVDERHRGAVDEVLRVLRGGAAHDEQAGERRRARDAGQVLQRAQRVAVGPGDARDLALVERELGHLARRLVAVDLDLLHVSAARGRRASPAARRGEAEAVGRARLLARLHGLVGLVGGHAGGASR